MTEKRKGRFVPMSSDDEQAPEGLVEFLKDQEHRVEAASGHPAVVKPDADAGRADAAADDEEQLSGRMALLQRAADIVDGDRDEQYGDPEDSFEAIATMWSAYLQHEIDPVDVSMMMVLLKAARVAGNKAHIDSFVDIAGYAACGGGLVLEALMDEEQP